MKEKYIIFAKPKVGGATEFIYTPLTNFKLEPWYNLLLRNKRYMKTITK